MNGIPDKKIVIDPDTILPAKGNTLVWGHRNERSIYPVVFENQHLASLLAEVSRPAFASDVRREPERAGTGQRGRPDAPLRASGHFATPRSVRAHPAGGFVRRLARRPWAKNRTCRPVPTSKPPAARTPTGGARSGTARGSTSPAPRTRRKVTQGYAMQRYMDACGGRGALPIKYNGSIFTVGQEPPPGTPYDPAKGQDRRRLPFLGRQRVVPEHAAACTGR